MLTIRVGMSFDSNLASFSGGPVARVWKQVTVDGHEASGCSVCLHE